MPTTDWCARVAAAIGPIGAQGTTIVALGSFGGDSPAHVESAHLSAPPEAATPLRSSDRIDLTALRQRLERAYARAEIDAVSTSRLAAIDPFGDHASAQAAACVLTIGQDLYGLLRSNPDRDQRDHRCLFIEIGLTAPAHGSADREIALLRSVLVHLSERFQLAFDDTSPDASSRVTPSEQVVLEQLVLGRSVKQIASLLSRSPHTVHDHVKSLHRKFGATTRGELIARALGHKTAD